VDFSRIWRKSTNGREGKWNGNPQQFFELIGYGKFFQRSNPFASLKNLAVPLT
jgi:hypothetical protein